MTGSSRLDNGMDGACVQFYVCDGRVNPVTSARFRVCAREGEAPVYRRRGFAPAAAGSIIIDTKGECRALLASGSEMTICTSNPSLFPSCTFEP